MRAHMPSDEAPARPAVGVPAYFGPWERDHWNRLIADAPSVVVLNPANGPGRAPSAEYRALRDTLRRAGTRVLVYVHTEYLTRDLSDVGTDVERSYAWFDADGVFFDEVPVENTRSVRSKLDRLYELSPKTCGFNTGRVTAPSWFRRYPAAQFVTFEGTPDQLDQRGEDPLSRLIDGPAERQWWLLHSAPLRTHRARWEQFRDLGLGLAYITNDRLPNPWDVYTTRPRR